MACQSIKATSSITTALCTAFMASAPQAKGPWLYTSAPGTSAGSLPEKHSMITLPVSFSYSPRISASVIGRVQGMAP